VEEEKRGEGEGGQSNCKGGVEKSKDEAIVHSLASLVEGRELRTRKYSSKVFYPLLTL